MKLIQSNIWGGKLKFQLTDYFAMEQPDILCMQEVNELEGQEAYLFAPLADIQAAGNFAHSQLAASYSQHYMNRTLLYGNAILSRLAFQDYEVAFTKGSFIANYDTIEHGEHARNFQHAIFDVAGTLLHVINYHGAYVRGSKAGNNETESHVQQIADYIQPLEGPVIVTGDFNVTPDSKTIATLNTSLRNLCLENDVHKTYSELSHHDIVCDYIFVNDLVQVTSFVVAEALISDHKALVIEFSV